MSRRRGRGGGRSPRPPGVRLAVLDEIEVVVEKLVAGGDGLARFDGIPIFVPRSAPGDRVRVRLVERRPGYGRAEILEILSPGPGRRAAPCPHFSRCGGCDLQHLEDSLQVDLKVAAARETLERIGGIRCPQATEVIHGDAWGYRLRTKLHIESGEPPRVGYYARGSHDLVRVDRCPILVPQLEDLLRVLPARLPADPPRRLDLAAGKSGTVAVAPVVGDLPRGDLEIEVAEFSYGYDARCFFQGHRGLLTELVQRVVGDWASAEEAFDLYAGVGLFALPLCRNYRRVVAVEGDRIAARYARNNGRRNRVRGLEVVTRAVESWIPALPEGSARVVVDPPRDGLPSVVRRALLERRSRRLTYVSCHPAVLARDLKELSSGYRLESLALIDLFPQTGHLEVVAQLVA